MLNPLVSFENITIQSLFASSRDFSPILIALENAYSIGNLAVEFQKEWSSLLEGISHPFQVFQYKDKTYLYTDSIFQRKQKLEVQIRLFLEEPHSKIIDESSFAQMIENWENLQGNESTRLFPEQKQAIQACLNQPFHIITGGPGTGKTTVVSLLLICLKELKSLPEPEEIALIAPTGRAAQRLTESIQHRIGNQFSHSDMLFGQTLHSLLQFRKRETGFLYKETRKLPHRLLIVDEASMIDLRMMSALFEAIDIRRTKVILLGDPNQLPSVEIGGVFSDMVSLFSTEKNVLTKLIHSARQRSDSQIQTWMKQTFPIEVKEATEASLELPIVSSLSEAIKSKTDMVWILKQNEASHKTIQDLTEELWREIFQNSILQITKRRFTELKDLLTYPISEFSQHLNSFRCLTIFRNGIFGSEQIHNKIERIVEYEISFRKFPISSVKLSESLYYEGLPLMITENDKTRKLFNGDVGMVLLIGSELRAVFLIQNKLLAFALDTLPKHEPAYFLTVHKSQGSEYDHVLLFLPSLEESESSELLSKQILYTAVTRARKKVILVGDPKTWEKGMKNSLARFSGLQI